MGVTGGVTEMGDGFHMEDPNSQGKPTTIYEHMACFALRTKYNTTYSTACAGINATPLSCHTGLDPCRINVTYAPLGPHGAPGLPTGVAF